jgi:hypothetical protein
MTKELTSEETTVIATYPVRHQADMARDVLEEQGIASFVVGDDVHTSLQFTDGVHLWTLKREAQAARDALAQAYLLPEEAPVSDDEEPTGSAPAWVRHIAGFDLIVTALIAAAIIIGLLIF